MKKKTAVILVALLMVSLFAFTGCADDIGDGIEKGAEDIGDDLTGDNKAADDKVDDNKTTANKDKDDGSKINN